VTAVLESTPPPAAPKPLTTGKQPTGIIIALWSFVTIPFVALIAAVPVAWGWGLNWIDVVMFLFFYVVAGIGIGTGFHRYLTHGSFKATRWLRVTLAVAGSLAIEGSPTQWVADHRRHHAFSDREGDPHSPWRYGESVWGLTKGLFYAHMGWLFHRDLSNPERFAPDLVADKDIQRVDRLFPLIVMWLKLGAAERRMAVPGVPSARFRRFTSEPIPMKSISPLARASGWASRSILRKTSESSLAGLPHHFSLRTRVMSCAVVSTLPSLNGPAVVSGFAFQPSLKTSGFVLVENTELKSIALKKLSCSP